jgi:heavy metal sensor kinase
MGLMQRLLGGRAEAPTGIASNPARAFEPRGRVEAKPSGAAGQSMETGSANTAVGEGPPDRASLSPDTSPAVAASTPARRPQRRALLLRWKLAFFYSTVLALMLSTFSLVVYWYMSSSLLGDIDRASAARATDVVAALETGFSVNRAFSQGLFNNRAEIAYLQRLTSIEELTGPWELQGIGVRIYHATGRMVLASNEVWKDRNRVPVDYSLVHEASRGKIHRVSLTTRDLGTFYSYSLPVFLNDQPWAVVEILSPLAQYNQTLGRLRQLLVLGTLLATALALFTGAALAEAALRPIDGIERTARRIYEKRDLSQRVPEGGARDELGRLSSTINSMLDQIEGMFDRQRRFLSDVSHELRTPLTTVRGEAELMVRAGQLDSEGLSAICSESERMARMVEDLLLLARTDEAAAMERLPVDLSALLQDVGRQVQLLGSEHHRVEVEAAPDLQMQGDRDRLKQLVLNLAGNALSHTPDGSTIQLRLEQRGSEALIEIIDDGPGIPPEDLPYLFDRFYRVDKARSRASGGTGLGLAIVQSIARAHEGSVEVRSTLGQGTRFSVRLPLERRPT